MPAEAGVNRVGDATAAAVDALAAAGCASPRLDIEILLETATGIDRTRLAADPDATLAADAGRAFAAMVRRRAAREPVAYITGSKGFRRIDLLVDRRVLIPRPESELLVELALEFRPRRVADIGTGSGAIALAIANELPGVTVDATDTSADALAVAATNARLVDGGDRVTLIAGTLPGGSYELIVANLPYISDAEWQQLEPEITRFEPPEALLAGEHGLDAIRELIEAGPDCDVLALEHGTGQGEAVRDLLAAGGFPNVVTHPDLAGHDRVTEGRRG